MAFEHKPGTFTLFKNTHKKQDNHPDYRGEGKDAAGNPIEVAAWIKEGSNGGKFMSCKFGPKREQQPQKEPESRPSKPAPTGGGFDDMEDDLPFR